MSEEEGKMSTRFCGTRSCARVWPPPGPCPWVVPERKIVATVVVRVVWEVLTCVLVERVISWEGVFTGFLDGEALMACRVLENRPVRCIVLCRRSECGESSWQSSRMLLALRAPPSSRQSHPR